MNMDNNILQVERKPKLKYLTDNDLINIIETKYNKLSKKNTLTIEQEKEIQKFYNDLIGCNIPINWHKYFYSRNDMYSKEYLPMTLTRKLVRWANKCEYRDAYADKNMLDIILPNVPHPKIILKNMNGYYYFNNKPVTRDEAISLCENLGKVIIKPSLKSQGRGIKIIEIKNGLTNYNNFTVDKIFDFYKENFCIQEIVQQHEKMAILNPSSVNTIRILTYRSQMEILILYTAIRIGRKNGVIDNESAGGISANINMDGKIAKYAIGAPEEGKIDRTDCGVIIEGYEVPSFYEAIETVKEQHFNLPFFDIIAWDIAIGIDGKPIVIEWNVFPGLSQSACGPAFGNYTERIITEILDKKK